LQVQKEDTVKRREFLKSGIGGMSLLAFGSRASAAIPEKEDIRGLFQSQDQEVMRLTETVYQKCILGKVFPAEAPMKHNWIAPGGGYRGQWIWDTMFVVDLLSILPGKEKVIRDVFQNYSSLGALSGSSGEMEIRNCSNSV